MFDNNGMVHGYAELSDVRSLAALAFPPTEVKEPDMANKVCQLIFAGLNGATFPVGYFPVRTWNSIDILSTLTDAIEELHQHGFVVSYSNCNVTASTSLEHRQIKQTVITFNYVGILKA